MSSSLREGKCTERVEEQCNQTLRKKGRGGETSLLPYVPGKNRPTILFTL